MMALLSVDLSRIEVTWKDRRSIFYLFNVTEG